MSTVEEKAVDIISSLIFDGIQWATTKDEKLTAKKIEQAARDILALREIENETN